MKLFEDQQPQVATARSEAVDFYPTPSWLAHALVERAALTADDRVLEPTCGDGAILAQIPADVPAWGIEIHPVLAAEARRTTGREIIVGDILEVALPDALTAVVGNPPFQQTLVEAMFERMHGALVDGGRMVLLLSAHLFQTSATVVRYAERFSLEVEMVPRDVFPGLQRPLVLARMVKKPERRIVGIAFAREIADLRAVPAEFRLVLKRSRTNVWVAAAEKALRAIGRPATVDEVARCVVGDRPTATAFWREALRKALQREFVRVGPATYALPEAA